VFGRWPPARAPSSAGLLALMAGITLATVGIVLAGGGPGLALLPVIATAVFFLGATTPLHATAAVLIFLLLGVDDTAERMGQWRTPLAFLGDLLHERLDSAAHLPGLAVTGMEVVAVLLLVVRARQRGRLGEKAGERISTVPILRWVLVAAVATVVISQVLGLLRGQPVVPWKIRNLLHPLLLLLLFDAAFRGPQDCRLVGRVLVAAALYRAVLAVIVQRIAIATTGGKYAHATSHGDSVLFATAAFLVLIDTFERPTLRRMGRTLLIEPVLMAGMMENGRRLVWVMLLAQLAVVFVFGPMRPWKRVIIRAGLIVLPLAAIYVTIGWNRPTGIFSPLGTIRGVSDTSYDHSAYWREVENWNLAMNVGYRPLLGLGLGGSYNELMANDDISGLYKEYREWPHNTVLGQLMLMGLLGFTIVWSVFAAGLYLAFRAFRMAVSQEHRVAALGCVAGIVACHMLAYGDTGAHYPQYKIVMALAVAFAGKLAVATGAWPGGKGTRPAVPVGPPAV
jgi:hypothetical protein